MATSDSVDKMIADHPDWRGRQLAFIRRLVHEADPEIIEESKWRGAPTWSHNGLVCLANIYKDTVKVIFSNGARLADPDRVFNSELTGNAWRGITLSEADKLDGRAFKKMVRSAIELNDARGVKKAPSKTAASTGKGRRKPRA